MMMVTLALLFSLKKILVVPVPSVVEEGHAQHT